MMKRLFILIMLLLTITPIVAQEATPEPTAESTAELTPEATAEATDTPIPALELPEYGVFYTIEQPFQGRLRTYLLYIPSTYDPEGDPIPLIVALHPASSTGESFATYSGFDVIAEQENVAVIYPSGVNYVWNDGREGDARVQNVDDVAFIQAAVDVVRASLNISPHSIYAAGYSMGGMMAYRLACALPETFAAVASVASTMPRYLVDDCDGTPPVSVMVIHGTDDYVIPWLGSRGENGYLSAAETIAYWYDHNGCTTEYSRFSFLNTNIADGTTVLRTEYVICENVTKLAFFGVMFGGHTYPGHPLRQIPGVDLTTLDINADAVIWRFFAGY